MLNNNNIDVKCVKNKLQNSRLWVLQWAKQVTPVTPGVS